MRPVTVAAVQVAPSAAPLTPDLIEANTARALALVEACVTATGAELVERWISATIDPATAMSSLTPDSSVPQPFDHLADRSLALIRRHADALLGAATCAFPHGSTNAR
ncbi:MAG TPA: hypothetical protein VNW50_03815 [Streptosporangiaceae bacterium]|nr:hypothetical protein [Streptosporangiaceae bacterium]